MGKGDKKAAEKQLKTTAGVINPSGQNYSNLMWGGGFGTPQRYPPLGQAVPRTNWNQQSFASQFGTPTTPEQLIALEPKLKEQGIEVLRNASGVAGDIRLPNGQVIDVISGAMQGGKGFQWLPDTPGIGGGGGTVGFGQGVTGQALGDYSNLMGRWGEFADTGGYTPEGLAAIRSRALSPIRSIYSRGLQELDRTRALQGGYSPGYATARGRFNREQGQLTSDAATNAEAAIAQMVQSGRLQGLSGMSGQYSAVPGLANMFGNQALQAQQNMLGLTGAYQNQGQMQGFPWGSVLSGAGAGLGAFFSDRNMKTDIEEVSSKDIVNKFKKLKIYEWRYKDDTKRHIGPMAQDFRRIFGKGDGKTIDVIDAIGASLAMNKALADKVG